MSDWVAEKGVGDFSGMGKSAFIDWLKRRCHLNIDKKIDAGAIKTMKFFLEMYSEEKKEKENDAEE